MNDELTIKRLAWQCRRGMLELDIFLNRFLERAYSKATPEEQALFAKLLAENDQDLFVWLTGRETPKDPGLAKIVNLVREQKVVL